MAIQLTPKQERRVHAPDRMGWRHVINLSNLTAILALGLLLRGAVASAQTPNPSQAQPAGGLNVEEPVSIDRANEVQRKISMGDYHLGRGEYDDGIAAYAEGLRLDPANAVLRHKLDDAMQTCKKEDALLGEDFQCEVPATGVPPPPPPSRISLPSKISLGDFLRARGEWDDAITTYNEALKLDPANAGLRQKRDNVIIDCKKENALMHENLSCGAPNHKVTPSPAPPPTPVASKIKMGDFFLARGEWDEAIANYDQALKLDPANVGLRQKRDHAIRDCKNEQAVLDGGFHCGAREPGMPPAPAANFTLSTTPPGAQVLIDGKSYGPSPVRATLALGTHTYTVKPLGAAPMEHTFTLRSGEIVTKTLSIGPGVPSPEPTTPAVGAPKVEERISAAEFHALRGEWDDAIVSYDEALKLDPANAGLRWRRDNAIKACQKENVLLHENFKCGASTPPSQ